jgi:hypothetical protein
METEKETEGDAIERKANHHNGVTNSAFLELFFIYKGVVDDLIRLI